MSVRKVLVVVALAGLLVGVYLLMVPVSDLPVTQAQQPVSVKIDESQAVATYANVCQVTGTREELIVDFAVDSRPFAEPPRLSEKATKPISVNRRIITNFYNAKRMLEAVTPSIKRHEEIFGPLELDKQNRLGRDEKDSNSTAGLDESVSGARHSKNSRMEMDDSKVLASYANFCRVTGTPEELIFDFGLNAEPFAVPTQPILVEWRVITNFFTGKRLMLALESTLRRHEATFGELETDVRKRVKGSGPGPPPPIP